MTKAEQQEVARRLLRHRNEFLGKNAEHMYSMILYHLSECKPCKTDMCAEGMQHIVDSLHEEMVRYKRNGVNNATVRRD